MRSILARLRRRPGDVIDGVHLLDDFRRRPFFLNDAITGRDQALERINRQVDELADLLALERKAGEDLRNNVTQLSAELKSTLSARDALGAACRIFAINTPPSARN